MNLSKLVRQEAKVSTLFPITHLNSPGIFESQSGMLGAVLQIKGISFEIEEPEILNQKAFLLHQALLGLDPRFMVYVTTHRQKTACTLNGSFKKGFISELNSRYHARFQNKALYTNTLYLTLVLKGDTSTKTASWLTWASKKQTSTHRDTQITALTQTLSQLQSHLAPFGATLLEGSDLLHYLGLAVNAGYALSYPHTLYAPSVATSIPNTFKSELTYPEGHLGQYVSRYQLL